MKKRIILLISLLFIGILIPIVKADSGWDSSYSSYDSGSSWSSSDYDSSSSWDYDYSGSYSSPGIYDDAEAGIIALIIIGTVFCIIIYTIFGSAYKKSSGSYSNRSVYIPNDKTQDEVNEVDPSININELVQYTYNLFVDVQKAWTDFDYDKLRELLSDELFNNYKMQLDTLSLENGKNIMDNFEFVNGSIVAIAKTDLTERVSIKLHVRMKDYVINTITNKVTHGNKGLCNGYYIFDNIRKIN